MTNILLFYSLSFWITQSWGFVTPFFIVKHHKPLTMNQDVTTIKPFNWEKQWYPIAVEEYTDKSKSQPISFLGNEALLWFDGTQWRVFEDKCPHRGVPLSEGRVENTNELLCAYHAWKFDGDGKCTSIPQSKTPRKEETLKSSIKSCVQYYPTQVAQGLIWAWGEKTVHGSPIPLEYNLKKPLLIEELTDPKYNGRYSPIKWNFRDLPYGWDMFMENTLDVAHVPVAHHGIVGNRYRDPKHIEFHKSKSLTEIPIQEGGTFHSIYPEDIGFKYIQSDPSIAQEEPPFSSDFRPPCLNKLTTNIPGGAKLILALYATPTKPGFCRYFGFQMIITPETKNGKNAQGLGFYGIQMPTWLLHILSSIFLHQDQVFLHHQERMLYSSSQYAFGNFVKKYNLSSNHKDYSSGYFMPNEHDQPISILRKWIYNKAGGGPTWGMSSQINGLPQRLPNEQLFDVYHSHTKNCLLCKKALHNIQIVKNISILLVVLSVIFIKDIHILLVTSLLFTTILFSSEKLIRLFYHYDYSHQDNH